MFREFIFASAVIASASAPALAEGTRSINAWGARFEVPDGAGSDFSVAPNLDSNWTTGSVGARKKADDPRISGASTSQAYRYSGPHAGGPANDLNSNGVPAPVEHPVRSPAYRYSGTHAGGPADALISNGTPRPVDRHPRAAAYRYSGPHAGGPANDVPRN